MKTWIDLSATALDLSAVANRINDRIQVLTKDRTGLIWMPHACTVIAGWESLTDDRWKDSILQTLDIEEPQSPVFTIPASWRMPQVMRALGAFKSAGEASRNGWNKDVEEGMTLHTFKLAHSKWVFTTFKVPSRVCDAGSWEEEEETMTKKWFVVTGPDDPGTEFDSWAEAREYLLTKNRDARILGPGCCPEWGDEAEYEYEPPYPPL